MSGLLNYFSGGEGSEAKYSHKFTLNLGITLVRGTDRVTGKSCWLKTKQKTTYSFYGGQANDSE